MRGNASKNSSNNWFKHKKVPRPALLSRRRQKRPSAEDPTSDNKKRRLSIASSPASQKPVKPAQTLLEKAFDPNFEASKVLESQAPVSAVPQSTSKWIQNLKLDPKLKEELVQSCKSASATVKSFSEEERTTLPQRAADFGFPVRLLTTAKDPIYSKSSWQLVPWRLDSKIKVRI